MAKELYCSFCGKSQHDVRKLIAGPTAFICDECVALCATICMHETGDKAGIGRYYVSTDKPLNEEALADRIASVIRAKLEEKGNG